MGSGDVAASKRAQKEVEMSGGRGHGGGEGEGAPDEAEGRGVAALFFTPSGLGFHSLLASISHVQLSKKAFAPLYK